MKKFKRISIIILGVIFIILGIAGLALPFLQGFLFLAIGLILLSLVFPAISKWLEERTIRFPKLHKKVKDVEVWVKKNFGDPDKI